MTHPLKHILSASVATLLVGAIGGCTVLPSSGTNTQSPWKSYTEAKAAFDRIDTSTTKEALVILGFDPAALPNTRNLNYVDVVNLFGSSFRAEDLPQGVKDCVAARDGCQGYVLRSQHIKNQRDGNIATDLFGFKKHTTTTGWDFNATLVLVNGKVAYKLWNGTPTISTTSRENNPLGPMQSLSGIIPKPF